MILANYAQQNRNCVREVGRAFTNPFSQFKPCLFMSFYSPDTAQTGRDKSSFNNGYNTQHAWHLAPKSGGIASTLNIEGIGTITASALAVKLAEAGLTGNGTLEAIGGLIVQLIADLEGDGQITNADVKAFLAAVANITGSGGVTAADLEGLGALICVLTGSGTTATSTLTGTGELNADLVVTGTGLTTSNVGQAVWSALAAANNASGTMGEKLNDAGSASNPWTEIIQSGLTAAEILILIKDNTNDIPTSTENADALLKRDMSAVTGEAARSPINALRRLRNKNELSGATLTVYKEDDTTSAFTATVTTDAGAEPITSVDPS